MENEFNSVDTTLDSADWWLKESDKLIQQFKECKTAHARNKLIPKLIAMKNKLGFEKNEVRKIIDENI